MITHEYNVTVSARITATIRAADQVAAVALFKKTLSSSILKYGFHLDPGIFDPEFRPGIKDTKLYCVSPYKITIHIK